MDLSTKYLGLDLRTPLVASSSPLSQKIDSLKKLEDNGASAVVLYSVFEEQLRQEAQELADATSQGAESFAEAMSYFPEPESYNLGPQEYLSHIGKAKEAVKIPIIGSLNGSTMGGWTEYAKQIAEAGADALELNIYSIPTDFDRSGAEVEAEYLDIVKAVTGALRIPVAVKLSPFFSNTGNMAKQLVDAGASGLVLFNRFYQPDIDLESLEVQPAITLSTSFAQRLPLRWTAILRGRLDVSIAATSGIHQAEDVLKLLMVGADVTMLCSTLLRNGTGHLKKIEADLVKWMETKEYESVKQMQGSMSQKSVENPSAFERAQYMKSIQSFKQ